MYERDISRVYSCMISRINIIALRGLLKAHVGCDSAFYVPHICMDGVGLKRVDYFPSIFITSTDMSGNMAYDVTKSGQNAHETHHFLALDPCLIYDHTDRYGWIWGSLCACAPARRHCRRLQPIAIGYSRSSSWPERSHAGIATKISDYGCSGLDRANTWTNSVLICDLWICHEMRYSLYVRRNARFFHLYENLKLQDRLISLTH